ncbi:hypothetical protein ACWCXX_04485 [Streptomyces sp. NPDC001732]
MRRAYRLLAGLLAAGALLTATGCAQSVEPIERLGRKAAQRVTARHHDARHPGVRPRGTGIVSRGRAERSGPSARCPRGVRAVARTGAPPVPRAGKGDADATPRLLELALRLTEC